MNTEEWAWLAGIIEGEGCINIVKKWNSARITINMTDEDIVRRIHHLTGVGNVYYISNKNITTKTGKPVKPSWTWSVSLKSDVIYILIHIEKWMGTRRKQSINVALEKLSKCVSVGEEKPITHGTRRGYHLELKRKIDPCEPCLEAGRAYQRDLYHKHKEMK